MTTSGQRVKVYTRSMNPTLYGRAMSFVDLPFPRERLEGTTADGYLFDIIDDADADWVINIDEDAFVVDNARILGLLRHMQEHGLVHAGMPDGGVVEIRRFNPLVINPFFSILHTAALRGTLTREEIAAFDPNGASFQDLAPKHLLRTTWEAHPSYEPFYKLMVWLSQHVPTLYLDAREHADGITTELLDHEGQPLVLHTWYSREYGRELDHTARINAIIAEACERTGRGRPVGRAGRFALLANIVEYKLARRLFIGLKRRYGL